jgi:hypothetical protein
MPLSLSDAEFAAVQTAAAPVHPLQRGTFLEALAKELERHPVIGPGLVHRCAADLQKTFGVTAHRETSHSAEPRHLRARQRAAEPAETSGEVYSGVHSSAWLTLTARSNIFAVVGAGNT